MYPVMTATPISPSPVGETLKDDNDDKESSAFEVPSGYSLSEQIALEADRAVQYRTCSWQKVHIVLCSLFHCLMPAFSSIRQQVCCFRNISVWLSCHFHGEKLRFRCSKFISDSSSYRYQVVFYPRHSASSHSYCRNIRDRAVHIPYRMARLYEASRDQRRL